MLKREDVLSLSYLKKTSFTGSCQGVRFLLRRDEQGFLQVFA